MFALIGFDRTPMSLFTRIRRPDNGRRHYAKPRRLEASDGIVRIVIYREGQVWACSVSDNGIGLTDKSNGLGSRIVDALLIILGGTLAIQSGKTGTHVLVSFPA